MQFSLISEGSLKISFLLCMKITEKEELMKLLELRKNKKIIEVSRL